MPRVMLSSLNEDGAESEYLSTGCPNLAVNPHARFQTPGRYLPLFLAYLGYLCIELHFGDTQSAQLRQTLCVDMF